jgi:hypothetical protein
MGYAGFSLKGISCALLPPSQDRGNGGPRFWLGGKGRIGHGARVIQFLFFCKKLLS